MSDPAASPGVMRTVVGRKLKPCRKSRTGPRENGAGLEANGRLLTRPALGPGLTHYKCPGGSYCNRINQFNHSLF